MQGSLFLLLVSTVSIGFFHALAPDHWLPMAMIGKAQKWSKVKLLWITFFVGLAHVCSSLLFGSIGIFFGITLSTLKGLEGHRGEIGLWLLIGFGIAYALWGIKHARSHKHEHIDQEVLRKRTLTMWVAFAVFVLGPCEPLIPLMFLGYNHGWPGVLLVSSIFTILTILMMQVQTILAFLGVQLIRHDIAERYAHSFAGLVIALTGAFLFFV